MPARAPIPLAFRLLLAGLLMFPAVLRGQPAPPDPASVVVVANAAFPGSEKVARTYMAHRRIPAENLILLETSTSERIPFKVYLETLHNPLLEAMIERGLVNALAGPSDSLGRKTATVISNPIRYLVLCHGVPAHVNNHPVESGAERQRQEKALKPRHANLISNFEKGPLAKTEAAVDAELALLLQRDMPVTGFLPNPYFRNQSPAPVQDILKVTRLDGPSVEAVLTLLEQTWQGEAGGLKGRAYVDEDGRGGNYQAGNLWLAQTAKVLAGLGFDLDHETTGRTLPVDARFDAPVLYAGWYAASLVGPFSLPGFRFPPGAIAAHLHSFSAGQIRSPDKGWVGPLVDRGVSATFGNTAEPYLNFTHQFNLFFTALANGWALGDAFYYALPVLSWQNVSIGDPLYRPFAVSLEEQLSAVGDPRKILEDQYVLIRQINRLQTEGQLDQALALANRGMRDCPGPALGLKRAQLLEADGQKRAARKALALFAELEPADATEWGLFAELADTLLRLGEPKAALRLYQALEGEVLPEAALAAFLKRGIEVANKAGQSRQAIDWRTRTTPPPPPEPAPAVPVSDEPIPAE